MDASQAFAGLNEEQARAVAAVRGPVCILAGAGSGKTTTITRRLAHQVMSGTFASGSLLAVTFTDKAAAEMRARLDRLGVRGIRARTFHSAALVQLRHFRPSAIGDVLSSKAALLAPVVRSLGRPHRFVPVADFAAEIEWAKNQRITPDRYLESLGTHDAPVDPEVMLRVFRTYEDRKRRAGAIDFEDMLELAIRLFEDDPDACSVFWERYRSFTVDEYQDVNLLQRTLLERWLGERDELCVVGDDYQAIYSFTGATPRFLLEMPQRYPNATVVRLVRNYRSTPQVLEIANRLVPRLGGTSKTLTATKTGPSDVVVRGFTDGRAERDFIVERINALHRAGVAYEDVAILYRTNARSEDYEEALSDAKIPYRVRDAAFMGRPAARQMIPRLERMDAVGVAAAVAAVATRLGYEPEPQRDLGAQEFVRQKDLARLVRLAQSFDDPAMTTRGFVAELRRRFAEQEGARGVSLLTLHRSKGLEFDAVFIPSLERGELPHRRAPVDEERRLFYVGMTRARRFLHVTWSDAGKGASRFVDELSGREPGERRPVLDDSGLTGRLKAWRSQRAAADGVPAYVVMHDSTLSEIARLRPKSVVALRSIAGMGPVKCDRYGDDILRVVAATRDGHVPADR